VARGIPSGGAAWADNQLAGDCPAARRETEPGKKSSTDCYPANRSEIAFTLKKNNLKRMMLSEQRTSVGGSRGERVGGCENVGGRVEDDTSGVVASPLGPKSVAVIPSRTIVSPTSIKSESLLESESLEDARDAGDNVSESGTYTIEGDVEEGSEDQETLARQNISDVFGLSDEVSLRECQRMFRPVIGAEEKGADGRNESLERRRGRSDGSDDCEDSDGEDESIPQDFHEQNIYVSYI